MADLGNLEFSIFYKDNPEELEKIKASALKQLQDMNLVSKVSASVRKKELIESIKSTLSSQQFEIGVTLDKDKLMKSLRGTLEKAGLSGNGYDPAELRAIRAQAARERAEAYVGAQRELARLRAASATKAELQLVEARERSTNAARAHTSATLNMNKNMQSQLGIVSSLKNQMLGLYSIYTVERFISSLVRIRGEFDMQFISLKAILQSGEKATEIFNQIKSLSVISPFQFKDLVTYAKQLSAYQIPNSELFDTTKRLADLSAGLGVDMNRIILAYGQVRSAAFLRGQELRQFTEAGIPMVQALADKFSHLENRVVSTGEVFDKISKRQVPFEMVKEVMEDLTDEGGRFYMMQEKQSESLQGKISNLRDAYDIMLNSIGEANDSILKGGVDALASLMENMDKFIALVNAMVPLYGTYRILVMLNNIALGKEEKAIISATLASKAKRAEMLYMAGTYRALTREEQIAISTRKQMTTADWKAVASSGALSKEYALRLVRLGKLSELQAMELAGIYTTTDAERVLYQSQVKKALSMKTNIRLGQKMTRVFGTFGVTSDMLTRKVNSLKLGYAGLAQTIVNTVGSIVTPANIAMLAITALGYAISNYFQEQRELTNRINQTGDAIKDSYDELNKFLANNPLSFAFNSGDDGLKALIEKYEEQIKESSPIAIEIIAKAEGIEDNVSRLEYLRKALEDTAQAYLVASDAKDIFEDANEKTDDWGIDKKLDKNLNDYAEALRKFNHELNSTKRADLLSKLPLFGEKSDEVKKNIEAMRDSGKSLYEIWNYYYNTFAKNANWNNVTYIGRLNGLNKILNQAKAKVEHDFETFYNDLEKQLKNKNINVNSDFGKTFVERLKEEWFTQNNVQPFGQELFNFKLDSRLYDQSAAVLNQIVHLMKLKGKEAVQNFSKTSEWSDGMDKALDAAIKEIKMRFPEFQEIIDKTINNKEFIIKIKTSFEPPKETELQQWAKSVFLAQRGLIEGISDPKLINNAIKDFTFSGLKPDKDTKSVVDNINDLKKKADDYNEKIDELTKVYNTKKSDIVKKELDEAIRNRNDILNQLAGYGYTYIPKKKGEKKDLALELLKERFKQIQDFKSMYEKYIDTYGEVEALAKTKASGLFAADLFKDSTPDNIRQDIGKEIDKIIKESGSNTKDRRALTESGFKFKGEIIFEADKEKLKQVLSELDKYISDESKKWDLFKNMYDSTGDKELAMKFAFGGIVSFENEADQWKAEIEKVLLKNGKNDIDISRLLGLSPDNVKKEIGGSLGKTLSKYVKEYQDSNSKIQAETVKNAASLISKYKDYNQQIIDIEEKATKDIQDLEKQRLIIGPDVDRIIAERKKRRDEDKAGVGFKQLKESEEWAKVFDDLDRVGTISINHLIEMLEAYKRSAGKNLKVTEYKELINALRKLREESIDRNPFKNFGTHVRDYIKSLKEAEKAKERYDAVLNSKIVVNDKETSVEDALKNAQNNTVKEGIENAEVTIEVTDAQGKATRVTTTYAKALKILADAQDNVRESSDPLKKAFGKIAEWSDVAAQGLGDLSSMFDSLGNGEMADTLEMLSGIASGIGSIAGGIASGDPVAIASGALSGITGIISSIAQAHDKKLDRAIEKSKVHVQQLQNAYDEIERSLEHFLGSASDLTLVDAENDRARLNELNSQINAIRGKGSVTLFDLKNLQKYSKEAEKLQRRVSAYDQGKAFGYQRVLMKEQVEELEKQRQAEAKKKGGGDKSKLADYDAQIAEMEQKIKDFAEEAAESLYGINLKDWASQLGDTLYEAWKKGEDGAEAFKKKSVELIGEVMNEMLKVGYLMPRMQEIQKKLFGEDGESGYFGTDGKLDEYEIADIGKDLMGLSDASEKWNKINDQLYDWVKRNYGKEVADALKGGSEESSGLSKGIQGVTENTADLLASYLNGVRADVATEVMLARQIVDEYFPRSNFLAEAQLNELRAISANTAANAEFAEEIRDILKRAQNGTLPFKVR